ncbi:MAG: hypothetical protein AAFR62_15585 [Cyanobacteria bacterium J06629_2]
MPQILAKEKLSSSDIPSWYEYSTVTICQKLITTELWQYKFGFRVSEKKRLRNLNFAGGAE